MSTGPCFRAYDLKQNTAFMYADKELKSKVGSHGLKLSTEGEGMHMKKLGIPNGHTRINDFLLE